MYFYVDDKEIVKEPRPGRQFVAWYNRRSQNNPTGYPHVDQIKGELVQLRAMEEEVLDKFLKGLYHRAPYIKPKEIFEPGSGL